MVEDLEHQGMIIDDDEKAVMFLCSLPLSYDRVVLNFTDKDIINFEDTASLLLAQEQK